MNIIEIKKRVEDLTEREAFVALFYVLLTKNSYFEPTLEYLKKNNKLVENFVYDLVNYYENYYFASPYKFLDNITNYIMNHEDTNLKLSEILDCIQDYEWD